MADTARVVITGVGAISPLGFSARQSWQAALEGVSGVGPITLFDARDYLVQIACEVKNFIPEEFMPAKEARRRDRFEQFAAVAVREALLQSGLSSTDSQPERIGVVISSAIGGITSLQDNIPLIKEEGPRKVSPFVIPMLMSNGAAGMASIDYGFRGPSFSVASA